MSRIRLLIADDDAFVTQMLQQLLHDVPEVELVGVCRNGQEAIERVKELKPHVVLMDVVMPILDGVEAARHLLTAPNPPRILMWTTFEFEGPLRDALETGASGFLLKSVPLSGLVASIRAAANGLVVLGAEVAPKLRITDTPQRLDLSERERKTLRLLCRGASNASISKETFVSESTVKKTVSGLKSKLRAPSRALLIAKATKAFPELQDGETWA
ncbi:MAG: response regulator transcription factor [Propionibacteriaceae bacterium]|nr:response regulator transcription factor [Propionibacteriaceae bacterium]